MTRTAWLLIGLGLVALSVGLSAWAYPSLPPRVPTHWDLAGNVNGYSSRLVAAALMPGITAFMLLLMAVLPAVSPRGFRLDRSANAYYESVLAVIGVLVGFHFVILRAELGGSAPSNALIFSLVGVLLVILGNLMGKFRKNFFIGIRTPWTLASDEVWLRTNRFGGRLMVVGGLALVACSSFPYAAIPVLLAVVALAALGPIVYSYILYRRIEGFGPNGQES